MDAAYAYFKTHHSGKGSLMICMILHAYVCFGPIFKGADQDCGSVCRVLLHIQETGEDRSQRDFNLRPSRFTSGEAHRGRGGR